MNNRTKSRNYFEFRDRIHSSIQRQNARQSEQKSSIFNKDDFLNKCNYKENKFLTKPKNSLNLSNS